MTNKQIKQFVKDRDKAVKDACIMNDLGIFKKFYTKYVNKGFYDMPLPHDSILEVSLRKMLYHTASATEDEKAYAESWLIAHGSSPDLSL